MIVIDIAIRLKMASCNVSLWHIIMTSYLVLGSSALPARDSSPLEHDNDKPEQHLRMVLTLDVSESMESRNRIVKLGEALSYWINVDIPNGTELGMVQFSSSASVLSPMVVVDEKTRHQLVEKIPKRVQGETCVVCGLQLALEVLKPIDFGGSIILITDVENSEPGQEVTDILNQDLSSRIQVFTIALSDARLDEIEHLAEKTEGMVFNIQDEQGTEELKRALLQIMNLNKISISTSQLLEPETSINTKTPSQQTGVELEITQTVETASQEISSTVITSTHKPVTNVTQPDAGAKFSLVEIGSIILLITVIFILLTVMVKLLMDRYKIVDKNRSSYEVVQT